MGEWGVAWAARRWWVLWLGSLACLSAGGCVELYPQVVILHALGEEIAIKDVSFSGCLWAEVLAEGETSRVGECLPGTDHVHFKRFDGAKFAAGDYDDFKPRWFNYRTRATFTVHAGQGVQVFTLRAADIEQDFDVAGPYSH